MKNLFLIHVIISLLTISCKNPDNPKPNSPSNSSTNNPPELQSNLSYTATSASKLQIDLSDKITDSNGDTWSITNANASHGTITVSDKIVSYTPNSGYTGNDTITVSIKDSKGNIGIGKIAITVSNSTTNHAPVLQLNLSYTAITATQVSIDLTTKITDADGDTWNITNSSTLHGSTTIAGVNIYYTSNTGYIGNDTITITFQDSHSNTSTGKIAISVSNSTTNHAPVVETTGTIMLNSNSGIQWISITPDVNWQEFNVTDADGDNVAIIAVSGYSPNISITDGVYPNISSQDIKNGNYTGGIKISPLYPTYAGIETLTVTFSDGVATTTQTFTIQFGEQNQIDTYNLLLPFINKTLSQSDIGSCTLGYGSITTTMTQAPAEFFTVVAGPSTYSYKILQSGNVEFTVGSVKTEYTVSKKNAGTITYLEFVKVSNGDTYNLY